MEAFLAKTKTGYIPADEESQERMRSIPFGDVIKVQYKQARDYERHKKFFAFINATFEMQQHFETVEHYRKWLTMKSGWYDTIVTPKGDTVFVAKSISFDKMEQADFDKLFKTCIDVFLQELGNGVTEGDILRVIDFS